MPSQPQPYRPRTPDRTGMLVFPGCMFVASSILSALLVYDSFGHASSANDGVMAQMLQSLAAALGPVGTAVLVVVMELSVGAWFVHAFLRYRTKVKSDRRAIGLPE